MLQRLGKIISALAQLVEQPRVLDGDDGLYGKVLDQLDLLVGEWANLLSRDRECADQLVLSKQRHNQERPGAPFVDERNKWCKAALVSRLGPSIRDVNILFCRGEPAQRIIRDWLNQLDASSLFGKSVRKVVHCDGAETCAFTQKHHAIARTANAGRVF